MLVNVILNVPVHLTLKSFGQKTLWQKPRPLAKAQTSRPRKSKRQTKTSNAVSLVFSTERRGFSCWSWERVHFFAHSVHTHNHLGPTSPHLYGKSHLFVGGRRAPGH